LRHPNRQEVEKLQERQQPQLLQVTAGAPDSQVEAALNTRIDTLQQRMEDRRKEEEESISLVSEEVKVIAAKADMLSSSTKAELTELASKIPALLTHAETTSSGSVAAAAEEEEKGQLAEQVEELKVKVESSISSMKSLVFSPLSVMFDAVRSEEWVGEDSYLPFTKLNINLGEGMSIDTGRFTAPLSGVYLFILNVYGAPRDAVVVSIRLNEIQEVASCSGVGKASQSVIVDMEKDDTAAVFVNDKSKLMDTGKNKFTHFLGILLRPDTVRF